MRYVVCRECPAIMPNEAGENGRCRAHTEIKRLREMAEGMAACVKALDTNQAWFSRSRIALTLRDSLRTWADEVEALATTKPPATAPQEDCGGIHAKTKEPG